MKHYKNDCLLVNFSAIVFHFHVHEQFQNVSKRVIELETSSVQNTRLLFVKWNVHVLSLVMQIYITTADCDVFCLCLICVDNKYNNYTLYEYVRNMITIMLYINKCYSSSLYFVSQRHDYNIQLWLTLRIMWESGHSSDKQKG